MPLFGRRAVVLIDTLRVEGLDVRFDTLLQQDNLGKAKIEVFNLNAEHRAQVAKGSSFDVELSVGYIDYDLTRIFKGTIRTASSRWEPPDWITTLSVGDGDKMAAARVCKSYPPGTSVEAIFGDITKALEGAGVMVGNAIQKFRETGNYKDAIKTLMGGAVINGPAAKELKRIARMANVDVGVQNGELVVTPFAEPLATEAIVLSPASGLIGSPEKAVDKDGISYIKVRALLLPGLLPKRKVHVKSANIDALYVVRRAQYKGDTSGQDWYADLECIAL